VSGEVVEIAGNVQVVNVNTLAGVADAESAACALNVEVVGVDPEGVPSITPVAECSVAQAGTLPETSDHVMGAVQLAVVKVCEYATPKCALASGVAVAMTQAGLGIVVSENGTVVDPPAFVAVTLIV
jgi:hypothetical protein